MSEATIRLQALGGAWETLGVDRRRGIVAEELVASSDEWGPRELSFQIKAARAGEIRTDLLAWTPVELEIDGVLCWAGRILERPSSENEHVVRCQGWQFHLDDDVLDRVYVHTRLGDYRDQRTFLTATLAQFHVAGTVSSENGVVTIGWPNGAVVPVGGAVGVTLDLGPDSTGKRAVLEWESSNNSGSTTLFVRAGVGENPFSTPVDDAFTFPNNSGASGTTAGTFATARRYVHVFAYVSAGATFGQDVWFKLKSLKIFRDTAYESGNASIIEADEVVRDALTFAPLLNQSTTQIADATFAMPEYDTAGYKTPREVVEAVNAYENYRHKIGGADLKTLVYGPKPSAPLFEVGEWSGSEFADASVAGGEIYDQVVVEGSGPDGAAIAVRRSQTGTLVDRRSFHRARMLPIRSGLTQAVAERFGDLWLTEHRTAPFAGQLKVAGTHVRRVLGGRVAAHELLLHGGEKIRLSHRVDPDTGAWTRDGRIAAVTYRHKDRSAEISIDDRRTSFEAVLARYGLLVDQVR